MRSTRNCIRCFKLAKLWSGYVIDSKKEKILAGWCSKRCLDIRGFSGHFRKEMKIMKEEKEK